MLSCVCAGCGSDDGRVVEAAKVPAALKRTGLRITFRHGPVPPKFVAAFYGTASNAAGTHINFGIFLKGANDELAPDRELDELVPSARRTGSGFTEGTVDAWSFIVVTSADRGAAGSRRYNEEAEMDEALYFEMKLLAPKAAADEHG